MEHDERPSTAQPREAPASPSRRSKENIHVEGKSNIQTKVVTTLFALFAEVERDLISPSAPREGLALGQGLGPEARRPERAPWASSRLCNEPLGQDTRRRLALVGSYPVFPRLG